MKLSTMARWLGANRVIQFVEELIRIGRAMDPGARAFSYATCPPTEYLLPQNSDFYCFNVYLHNQREFEATRCGCKVTGEHPLILGNSGWTRSGIRRTSRLKSSDGISTVS
jgi:hypothetical protein